MFIWDGWVNDLHPFVIIIIIIFYHCPCLILIKRNCMGNCLNNKLIHLNLKVSSWKLEIVESTSGSCREVGKRGEGTKPKAVVNAKSNATSPAAASSYATLFFYCLLKLQRTSGAGRREPIHLLCTVIISA